MRKWIFLVIIVVPLLIFSLSAEKRSGETDTVAPPSFMEDVKVENTKNSVSQWTLTTKRTVFSESGHSVDMEYVKVEFSSDEMTVNADSGSYDTADNSLFLSGNINAETDDFTIKTDRITFRSEKDEIFTDDKVLIEGKNFRIEGEGLSFANKTVRLLDNVRAEFF